MSRLAGLLAVISRRRVVDQTGVSGYFDFETKWPAISGSLAGPDGKAALIAGICSHVGLRLVSATGPLEYLVVDHAEMPAPNH